MSSGRRKKGLSAEDRALWNKVVKDAQPLNRDAVDFQAATESRPQKTLATPVVIKPFRIGQKLMRELNKPHYQPDFNEEQSKTSPNMDGRNFQRLKKGKLPIDGKIDLHGMTLAQAHPTLIGFVQNAFSHQKRLLLVITGKGKTSRDQELAPARRGVLNQQVPQWLKMAPLSPMVLQVTQAHPTHGGGGAYYVYLRRHR